MEPCSVTTFMTDGTQSSGTADIGGESEPRHAASQTISPATMRASISSDAATVTLEGVESQANEVISKFRTPNNFRSDQALSGRVAKSATPFKKASATSESHWRPTYLRRRVLAAFSVAFLLMIGSLEVLNALSSQNGGIARGWKRGHYLWTYGPTAFLTLIAATFNRVEYQAKLMAPWERLSRHPAPAQRNLLLDYISPLQPVSIYKSLKHKDFTVAATITISLIIKILIVFSSGLITLSRIAVHHPAMPMEIENVFVDDKAPFKMYNSLPYYVMQGLIGGSDYPPGISNEFAYQSVKSNLPATAQYEVVVDGLATNLQCEHATLDAGSAVSSPNDWYEYRFSNVTISSPDCDVLVPSLYVPSPRILETDAPDQIGFGKFEPVQCNGTTDDAGKRMLVMLGLEKWFMDETVPADEVDSVFALRGRLIKSAQILCTPLYEINRINVVQNGTEVQSVKLTEESSNRSLDSFFSTFDYRMEHTGDPAGWRKLSVGQDRFELDDFMYNALKSQAPSATNVSFLFNPHFIQEIATRYYQWVGAIIAEEILMQPASLNTTGSSMNMEDCLVVREWAVQWMVGLISTCLILSLATALLVPRHGILPRNPSTLPGIAALFEHSPDLLERLRYSGDANSKTLRLQLDGSTFQSEYLHTQDESQDLGVSQRYIVVKDVTPENTGEVPWRFSQSESTHIHPWVLNPATRLSLGVILVASVIALEVILQQSRSHEGLGDVGDNAYIHYTWTSLPALIFGCLAMMLSSMDFSIRSLAPYTSLCEFVTGDTFRILDFLDMSVPSAIFREAKLRNVGALATTSNLLVASFFTVFSGSLFQGAYFPSTEFTLLRANTSFGWLSPAFDVTPSLILLKNWSYPSFTYEDLVFPQFIPDMDTFGNQFSNSSLLSIKAVLPAVRSRLECRMYDANNIRVQIKPSSEHNDTDVSVARVYNNLWIDIEDEDHMLKGNFTEYVSIYSNTSYFATDTSGYSDRVFVWGMLDPSKGSQVRHIAGMGCNQSLEVVDVQTNFIGADLTINVEDPPLEVPDTRRSLTIPLDLKFVRNSSYNSIPNVAEYDGISGFFILLTRSRWAIPLSMFGGGSDGVIAAAIKFQHGIIFAQKLNRGRVPATEANATLTPEQLMAGENDASCTYEATVIDEAGRQRVVQDAISTRVLEALLLVTLILLGVGWFWLPKTNVFPKRDPTTIASAVALLAGGNLIEWLGEDGNIASALRGRWDMTRFWMGWGTVPDEEGILMGNENENGISRFGIFAVKADYDDYEETQ